MGLRMPASLIEIGFVTHREEARVLASEEQRERIAAALAEAVLEFGRRYDARRGAEPAREPLAPASSSGGG
jgi:hypothetical protein